MKINHPALDILTYASNMTQEEPPQLAALRKQTIEKIHGSQMLSSHLQGRILALLSRLIQPKTILEIGTYTGYSALCLAEGLQPEGTLHTIDRHHYTLTEKYFNQLRPHKNIHYHIGLATNIIPSIPGPFDIIFLDADKKQYPQYSLQLIPLISPGGIIIADNVLWKGSVLNNQTLQQDPRATAMHKITQQWKQHPLLSSLLLPIDDGLLIAQKITQTKHPNDH